MSTNCVTPYELGKINALLSAIDSLMPAGISQIYASIWKVILFNTYFSMSDRKNNDTHMIWIGLKVREFKKKLVKSYFGKLFEF